MTMIRRRGNPILRNVTAMSKSHVCADWRETHKHCVFNAGALGVCLCERHYIQKARRTLAKFLTKEEEIEAARRMAIFMRGENEG